MNYLIVVGHPDINSFCHNGIFKTIVKELTDHNVNIKTIDLYQDNRTSEEYRADITWADYIYFISPVWWFRCTPKLEEFFDNVFTPKFAYKFMPLFFGYAYPKPLLSHKKVRTYLTHGAPSLPVYTLYLNAVKLRLVLGVYSFVFGWFKTKTRQFWSVPFVSHAERERYLTRVRKDIRKDLF